MDYLQIRNWSKFQQYKDRNPPWIKLHTSLLENDVFEEMNDINKLTLLLLWLLASRLDNKIPNNPKWLQRKLSLSRKPDIEYLYKLGYLEGWAGGQQCDWDNRQISDSLRKSVLAKCGNKCVVCESDKNMEIDHIIPISKGGKTEENNLQGLCRRCNRKKHNKPPKPPYKPCTDGGDGTYTETETETETEREGETERKTEKNNIFSQKSLFETARKEYPGTKRGLDEEWDYLDTVCRKYKLNREQTVPKIVAGVNRLLKWRNDAAAAKIFVPSPKDFNTWLYNRCWTIEFSEIPHEKSSAEIRDKEIAEYDKMQEGYG